MVCSQKPSEALRMAETKKIKLSMNHSILPPEMLVKMLKLLNYKDLCKAQLICKRWNDIAGKLKKKVAGKILYSKLVNLQSLQLLNHFHL